MKAIDLPTRFPIPFGNSAGPSFTRPIPVASQIGIQAGAASLTDGFVPVNFLPTGAGGTPPFGQDFNGLLFQSTAWSRWQGAGAPVAWDSAFSASIGGYPAGAIVAAVALGFQWFCTVDDNTTNPETGGAGWTAFSPVGFQTGHPMWRPTAEVLLPWWVKSNGTTIGDATSGATQLASPLARALYGWYWANFSQTRCPVAGGVRGANANADFDAHKPIGTLLMQGVGPKGMDTMGGTVTTLLNGVPVTVGSATTAGSVLGENLHALILAENAPHTHTITDPQHRHTYAITEQTQAAAGANFFAVNNNNDFTSFSPTGISINSSGSGTAHNTVDLSVVGSWYFHL